MSSTTAVSPSCRSEEGRRSARCSSALALAAVLGGYAFILLFDRHGPGGYHTVCAFKWLTGIACPGCGMGRATLALLHGDPLVAWSFHTLALPFNLAVLIALIGLFLDLVRGERRFAGMLQRTWPRWATVLAMTLIMISWAIGTARGV